MLNERAIANKENLKSLIFSVGIETLVECFGVSVYKRYYEIMNNLEAYENEKTLRVWDEYLLENDFYNDAEIFEAVFRKGV